MRIAVGNVTGFLNDAETITAVVRPTPEKFFGQLSIAGLANFVDWRTTDLPVLRGETELLPPPRPPPRPPNHFRRTIPPAGAAWSASSTRWPTSAGSHFHRGEHVEPT